MVSEFWDWAIRALVVLVYRLENYPSIPPVVASIPHKPCRLFLMLGRTTRNDWTTPNTWDGDTHALQVRITMILLTHLYKGSNVISPMYCSNLKILPNN